MNKIGSYKFYINDRQASKEEIEKISSFLFQLLVSKSDNKIDLLFRGETLKRISEKLNIDYSNGLSDLNYRLFLIGEKGRHFFKEIQSRDAIDNCNNGIFDYLFSTFHKIFKTKDLPKSKKIRIDKFKEKNELFAEYFSDKAKKSKFIEIIEKQKDEDKIQIRDYYMTFLHRYGKGIGFYERTFWLSTSKSYSIANSFSENNSDSIILVSWMPKLKKGSDKDLTLLFEQLSLPVSIEELYPEQKEISLKGGILPHYLLGYIIPSKNEFIINPNILKQEQGNDTLIEGFMIDQSTFKEEVKETRHKNYYIFDSLNYRE